MKHLTIILLLVGINVKSFAQCNQDYSWAKWSNFNGTSANGTILVNGKDVDVTMSANYSFSSTNEIFLLANFFKQFSGYATIPNATVPLTTWAVGQGGKTTMCFSEPVTNPILLFASLGRLSEPVTLSFSEPYVPLYDGGGMTFEDSYSLVGYEGNSIVMFPGTFTCLTINSTTPEYYTNITWGLQPPLFPVIISGNLKGCGSVTLKASGGNSYKWSGGKTPNNATNTFETSGVYTLITTDLNGCKVISLKTVTVLPKSIINSSINKTICQGESYVGYKTSGIYTDTLKTSAGCDSVRTLKLDVLDLPQIIFNNDKEICNGKTIQLAPTFMPNNTSYKYKWSTSETTPKISIKQAGTYELIIENGICSTKASTVITEEIIPKLKPDETFCLKSPILILESGANSTGLKYLWTPTNSTNPTLTISQIGEYKVKVTTQSGCEATRTITIVNAPTIDLGIDRTICEGEVFELIPTIVGTGTFSYLWTSGETTKNLKLSKTGEVKISITQNSCTVSDSMLLTVNPLPKILENETTCEDKQLVAGTLDNNLSYLWEHSGEKTRKVKVQNEGAYKVKISNQFGCSATRTINVVGPCSPKIFVPNAFTPNKDGINDDFKIIIVGGTVKYLYVYNRWGEPIYTDTNPTNPQWDGKFKGEVCPEGTYAFKLIYKTLIDEIEYNYEGTILLIR